MGGKKAWNGGGQGSRQYGAWGYWRGTWQARSPRSAFPPYDQTRHEDWTGHRNQDSEAPEPPSFTQALQGSLNSTRKTEQRVVTIQHSLEKRQQLWELYVRDMKEALKKEQGRFSRDMEKLRADLDQAMQNQEGARAELLRVASLAGRAPEVPAPDTTVDRMFDAWQTEMVEDDAQAILRRAMESSAGQFAGPPPGLVRRATHHTATADAEMPDATRPAGPPPSLSATMPTEHGGAFAAPTFGLETPHGADAYPVPAVRDPYLPSPGHTALRPVMPSVSPNARVGPYPEGRNTDGRAPAPAAAEAVAARLAATRAMEPFGGAGRTWNVGALRSIDPAKSPVPTFIEDDEELSGPPDPGGLPAASADA